MTQPPNPTLDQAMQNLLELWQEQLLHWYTEPKNSEIVEKFLTFWMQPGGYWMKSGHFQEDVKEYVRKKAKSSKRRKSSTKPDRKKRPKTTTASSSNRSADSTKFSPKRKVAKRGKLSVASAAKRKSGKNKKNNRKR